MIVPAYTAVEQPGRSTHNPGLVLDYQRFSSDLIVAYRQGFDAFGINAAFLRTNQAWRRW